MNNSKTRPYEVEVTPAGSSRDVGMLSKSAMNISYPKQNVSKGRKKRESLDEYSIIKEKKVLKKSKPAILFDEISKTR